ncbi:hypothetical protein D9M71_771310 [compost metagenome]
MQLTGLSSDELHIQMGGKLGQQLFVGQVDAMVAGVERQQTVQRAGVQQLPAQLASQQPGYRAFARTAWPVNGDDRCQRVHDLASSATRMPTSAHSARKLGNEVATLAQSWMRIGALARSEATLKAMAIRWSP